MKIMQILAGVAAVSELEVLALLALAIVGLGLTRGPATQLPCVGCRSVPDQE